MNSLQIVLVTIGIIGLCSALPISLPTESAAPQWIVGSIFLLGAALITVGGCLCCQRKKGFKEFNNEPGTASHVVSAESPFPIFRPLNQAQQTPIENQTEATPLKHPDNSSGDGAESPALPHSNHVTSNTGLLNQMPNDNSVIVANLDAERVNNFETPAPPQPQRQHISPINNIASIRNNMQIISNAIINIVTHDQIEIDNNNGPISELDIQNIANNNAEGYIRNQNEIYENQNLEARQDEEIRPQPPDENLMTENYQRNMYAPSCSTDFTNFPSTSACPNVANAHYTDVGAGESGNQIRKETDTGKSDLNDSASDRFSKDLSFPEFSPSRNLMKDRSERGGIFDEAAVNPDCRETSYESPKFVMDKSQADDVNEALRVLESVLSGESDCDSLSCSSLCEVQLDFGNDNSTDDVRETSERIIRDIDSANSRETSKPPETCVVNLEDAEYHNNEDRNLEEDTCNLESDHRQCSADVENTLMDVESPKSVSQIKCEVINISEKAKTDGNALSKTNEVMTKANEQNDLKKSEIDEGSDSVNNVVSEDENADLVITKEKTVETECVVNESSKTCDKNIAVENSSPNVVNFQIDPALSTRDKNEVTTTPENAIVPNDTVAKPVKKSKPLGFSNAKNDEPMCDDLSDPMRTLSSPELEFDLDTKTIEVLESLNITTSTPEKPRSLSSENIENPEVVSIRKELQLQKKLCYDPSSSPAKKPNYAFLKSGQINLESWDKFLGDSFERSNEEDDFEFDNLDEHNENKSGTLNATYTKESSDEVMSSAGYDENMWEYCAGYSDKENQKEPNGTFTKDSTLDSDSDVRYNTSSGNEDEDSEKIAEIRRALFISLPGAQGPSTKDFSSGAANGTKSAQNTPDNVVQAQKRNILGILDAGFGLATSSFQFPDYFINEANGSEERNEIYIRYNAGGVCGGGVLSPIAEDWSGEDNVVDEEEEGEGEASETPEQKISSGTATESAGRTFVINDNQGGDNSTSYSDRSALTSDKPRQVLGSWCSNDTLFNVEDALDVEKITSPAENNDASYENCVCSPQNLSKHTDNYILENETKFLVNDQDVDHLENEVSNGQEENFETKKAGVENGVVIFEDSKNCDVENKISLNESFPTVVDGLIEKPSDLEGLEIHVPENETEMLKNENAILSNGDILKIIDNTTNPCVTDEEKNCPKLDVIENKGKCDTTNSVKDFENVKLEFSKLDTVSSDFVDVQSDDEVICTCPNENTSTVQEVGENFVQKSNISNLENTENAFVNVNHNQNDPETNRIPVEDKNEQNLNVPENNSACDIVELAQNDIIKMNNINSSPNKIEANIAKSDSCDLSDKENDRRFSRDFVKQVNGDFLSNEQKFSNTTVVLRTNTNVNKDDNFIGHKKYLIKKSEARLDLLRVGETVIEKIGNKMSENIQNVNNHITNGSARAEDDEDEDSSSEHENEDTISSNTDDYDTLTSSSQSGQEYELHGDINEEDDDSKHDYEIEVTRDALDATFTLDGENDPWICNIKFTDSDMMTTSFSSESPLPSPRTQDGVLEMFQVQDQDKEENLDDDTGWESEDTSCEFEWKSGDNHRQHQEESKDSPMVEDRVALTEKEGLKNGDMSNGHKCPEIRIDEFMEDGTFETVEETEHGHADEDTTLDDTMVTALSNISKNDIDEDIEENEEDNDEEYDGSSDDGSEEIEFVPSTWNALATPAKSSLKTPDSSAKSNKGKSVVFKKEKYMSVYEYPREQEHCTYIEPMYDSSLSYAPNGPVQCFDRFFVTSTTLPFNEYEFYPTTNSDTSKNFNTGDQFNWLSQQSGAGRDPFDCEDLLNSATDFDLQGTMDTEYNKAGAEDDQFSLDPMPGGGGEDDCLYEFTAQNLDNFDQDSPWTASGNEEVTSFISPDTPDSNNSQINLKFRTDGPKNVMNVADFATPDSGIEITPNPENHNKSMKFAEIGNELQDCEEVSKNVDTRNDVSEKLKESKEFNNIDNLGMLCHTKSSLKLPLKVHDVKASEEDVNDDDSQVLLGVNETPDSTNHKNNVSKCDDSSNYKSEGDVGMNEMNQNEELMNEQDAVQSVDNFENTLNTLKQSLDMTKVSDKINSDLLLSDVGSANSGDEDSGIDSATTLIDTNSRS